MSSNYLFSFCLKHVCICWRNGTAVAVFTQSSFNGVVEEGGVRSRPPVPASLTANYTFIINFNICVLRSSREWNLDANSKKEESSNFGSDSTDTAASRSFPLKRGRDSDEVVSASTCLPAKKRTRAAADSETLVSPSKREDAEGTAEDAQRARQSEAATRLALLRQTISGACPPIVSREAPRTETPTAPQAHMPAPPHPPPVRVKKSSKLDDFACAGPSISSSSASSLSFVSSGATPSSGIGLPATAPVIGDKNGSPEAKESNASLSNAPGALSSSSLSSAAASSSASSRAEEQKDVSQGVSARERTGLRGGAKAGSGYSIYKPPKPALVVSIRQAVREGWKVLATATREIDLQEQISRARQEAEGVQGEVFDESFFSVGCDRCGEWRRLPRTYQHELLPTKWFCEMNCDPLNSMCVIPVETSKVAEASPLQAFPSPTSYCSLCFGPPRAIADCQTNKDLGKAVKTQPSASTAKGSRDPRAAPELLVCVGSCGRAFHVECTLLLSAQPDSERLLPIPPASISSELLSKSDFKCLRCSAANAHCVVCETTSFQTNDIETSGGLNSGSVCPSLLTLENCAFPGCTSVLRLAFLALIT
jgi:hypothetical protein